MSNACSTMSVGTLSQSTNTAKCASSGLFELLMSVRSEFMQTDNGVSNLPMASGR